MKAIKALLPSGYSVKEGTGSSRGCVVVHRPVKWDNLEWCRISRKLRSKFPNINFGYTLAAEPFCHYWLDLDDAGRARADDTRGAKMAKVPRAELTRVPQSVIDRVLRIQRNPTSKLPAARAKLKAAQDAYTILKKRHGSALTMSWAEYKRTLTGMSPEGILREAQANPATFRSYLVQPVKSHLLRRSGHKKAVPAYGRVVMQGQGRFSDVIDVQWYGPGDVKLDIERAFTADVKRIAKKPNPRKSNPSVALDTITRGKPFDYGNRRSQRDYTARFSDGSTATVGPGVIGNSASDTDVRSYFRSILAEKNLPSYLRNPGVGSFLDSNLSATAYLKAVKAQQKHDLAKVKLAWTHEVRGGVDVWTAPYGSGKVSIYHGKSYGIPDYAIYWNHSHYSNEKTLAGAKTTGRQAAGYFTGVSSNAMGRMH